MRFGVRIFSIGYCWGCFRSSGRTTGDKERSPVPRGLFMKILCTLILFSSTMFGGTRLKELASLEGVRDNQLMGYGLVVGLSGTGDKVQTVFSTQTLTNILQRMGVTINPTAIL